MQPNFFHHLHPPSIPAAQARWRYTLGAGGTAIFLVLVLILTGVLEVFFYIPTPADAALSIQNLSYHVPFGWLVRNLHYWAGQALLLVAVLHLIRVIFTGAYTHPRRFNYLLGWALFFLLSGLNFTGYILRWDTNTCWLLTASTNLLRLVPLVGNFSGTDLLYNMAVGGGDACQNALPRIYAWHLFGLLIPAAFLTGWHAFRVRRDGGIAVPPSGQRENLVRISRFELVRREVLAMLLTLSALIVISVFFQAPLTIPMGQGSQVTTEAQAPWFFLWVQQLLKWGDPFWFGLVLPALLLIPLILIPYILPAPNNQDTGRWFSPSTRLARVLLAVILLILLTLSLTNAH